MTARKVLDRAMTEAELQSVVIEYAHLRGWLVHHDRAAVSRGGRWATHIEGDAGFPDLVLARSGTVLFVELKTEKATLAVDQQTWGRALGALLPSNTWHCWRPADWSSGLVQKVLA